MLFYGLDSMCAFIVYEHWYCLCNVFVSFVLSGGLWMKNSLWLNPVQYMKW